LFALISSGVITVVFLAAESYEVLLSSQKREMNLWIDADKLMRYLKGVDCLGLSRNKSKKKPTSRHTYRAKITQQLGSNSKNR